MRCGADSKISPRIIFENIFENFNKLEVSFENFQLTFKIFKNYLMKFVFVSCVCVCVCDCVKFVFVSLFDEIEFVSSRALRAQDRALRARKPKKLRLF